MHDLSSPSETVRFPQGVFWNPYVQISVTIVLTAAAQVLLKAGANSQIGNNSVGSWLGFSELASGWTWLGIFAFVASFGGWLYALRFLPLGIAFALTNAVHVLVPLGSLVFLHEQIGLLRAGGILVIIAGLILLAQPVARAEERV